MNRVAVLLLSQVAFLICFMVVLAGCKSSAVENAGREPYRTQFEAMAKGDVDLYMSTIDPSSPIYFSTKSAFGLIRGLKVTATLDRLEVLSESADSAEIRVVVTTKGNTPGFKDNTISQTNALKKVDGKWLISSAKVEEMKYL